ncbi:MAG: hypothetical protein HY332_09690 [Chloroflexi bacterium]|nr:hypothetical protein [Chloroflexota bacterium]
MVAAGKKDRERVLVTEFRALCPEVPPGILADWERPDFLIDVGAGTLGIEVAEYIRGQSDGAVMRARGSPIRAREQRHKEIAKRVEFALASQGAQSLHVTLHFVDHPPLSRRDVERVVRAVAALALAHVPDTTYRHTSLDWRVMRRTEAAGVVRSMSVWRMPDERPPSCAHADAAFTSVSSNEIQALINDKAAKASKYSPRCVETWLLIVAAGGPLSSDASLSQEILSHSYTGPFERVYFYQRLERLVHRLTVRS